MYEKSFVKDIFYTGIFIHNYDEQLIVDILFLLNEGLLNCLEQKIFSVDVYQQYLDKIKSGKIPRFDIAGGEDGHLALKMIGKDYLNSQNYNEVCFESQFEGYVPDVMSTDGSVIVECGNTNPDKVFNYFKNKQLKKLVIIPYPVDVQKEIFAYVFTPGEELADFLLFRAKEIVINTNKFHKK